ncbi:MULTISPECIES: fumarylacetoacetate hydrolase family protein [unclassified Bradyrhizobium]|uniref:fumarylacetoacetate hydrolase family protein n=1 Tax=unclassified Bradyrhizobium TaxID=2631580 RepID=UPI001FF26454|nr:MULTISPECIES: fumarylacetoacetate hydrolase family protein [unclassified Bradyrhizobium]MCJ9699832.1 fumarylacetoacetate hydrolase family protein [Bradyrhizobium sp. SHOUNA76]MCJ9728800.1 fumarylacetoacetate hydrolase family protein [Bradyrhizobium sp. PRIMUS42]
MHSRRKLMKAGLAAAALATTKVSAQAAGETASRSNGSDELPRKLTILSIRQDDGRETMGVKTAAGVLDVAAATKLLGLSAPLTLEALLVNGGNAELKTLVDTALKAPNAKAAFLDESKIKFGRLFTKPGKIVCLGLNYREHVEETGQKLPPLPILFNKYNNSLAPHMVTVQLPPRDVCYKFDYETELVVVIGRKARNVRAEDALSYVAGYAVGNDFTSRDLQLEVPGGQWMVGKTLDDFAPIGPYFVSADQIDPNNLDLETRVNGEVRQSSNTTKLIFNPQKIIAYASRLLALEPGDIIFTGTPSGVITGYPKEKQIWLKAGDKIESTIQGLGTLSFTLA